MSSSVRIQYGSDITGLKTVTATSILEVSWELSGIGVLTCEFQVEEAIALGMNPTLILGKDLLWDHAARGRWGGRVMDSRVVDGTVALSCESWAAGLRGLPTDGKNESGSDAAGGGNLVPTVKRLIDARKASTGIATGTPFEASGAQPAAEGQLDAGNDVFGSLLPNILDNAASVVGDVLKGPAWYVDPTTKVMTMSSTYGTDRSATVNLADRIHNASSAWADDTADIVNYVAMVATINTRKKEERCAKYKKKNGKKTNKCKKWEVRRTGSIYDKLFLASDAASEALYGRLGITEQPPQVSYSNEAAPQAHVAAVLKRLVKNFQGVTVTCTNEGNVWSTFHVGDVISVDLANSGVRGKMRVRSMAYSATDDLLTVSGEAELS